jgi:glycosyltransferase involved in cell wall biosynthesis
MATWNGARFLAEQLGTVVPQLAPGDELVIVDDASHDRTMEILECAQKELQTAMIRLHRNQCTLGAISTFERALALGRGEILLLCDQDDYWLPGKVERIRRAFAEDAVATLVLSDAQLIDGEGNMLASSLATWKPYRPGLFSNLVRNTFLGCTMAFRRSSLKYCLPFPAGTPMHDQWIGMLHIMFGKVVYLDEPLILYRRHGGNATADTHASWAQMARWRLNLTRNLAARWWRISGAGHP